MVCLPAGICSTLPPTITVFVPPAPDAVEGWVPRTDDNLEVRALVDDGGGSGAASATLTFDACPAAAACSYAGTAISTDQGVTTFSFQVPRKSQAAGAEAPLAITVKGMDKAGNEGKASYALQIDDAPPHIGAFTLVTAGILGEDGNTWFPGGAAAPTVEIAVPVSDLGVGVASLSLQLVAADVVTGTPLSVPGTAATDGTVHFSLPAGAVRGREGQLHFSLTAADKLQHTSTIPAGNSTAIWVDDLPPTVTLAKVDYANASPALSAVCGGPNPDPKFVCGRQGATHLLRDDIVKTWFDAYDCGVGMGPQAQQSATVKSGGQTNPAVFSSAGTLAGPCASGNPTHRYTFTLNLATMAPALDPPDATGTAVVQLISSALDRFAHAAQSVGATSGDGLALVSLWRWKANLTGDATGSPALLLGSAGSRQVAIGTNAVSPAKNLFVLNPDGSFAWPALAVPSNIDGDVAVGSEAGLLYVVSPNSAGVLNIITSSGTTSAGCSVSTAKFGKSPVITSASGNGEVAVVASTQHSGTSNLFVFKNGTGCSAPLSSTPVGTGDFNGATAIAGSVFLANSQGFTSVDQNGTGGFDLTTQASYSPAVGALAPPSISIAPMNAIFGGTDIRVRRTLKTSATSTSCGLASPPCWIKDTAFNDPNWGNAGSSSLPFTPVFDGSTIWTSDNAGVVYTWAQITGQPLKSIALGAAVSSPVLLQNGSALIVHHDGSVEILTLTPTTLTALTLVNVGVFAAPPVPPAIDVRAGSGVAYVPAPQGWVYALQIPQAPLPASTSAWPRPGRDSCNSRSTASLCQ
jgi:hypothetical protein